MKFCIDIPKWMFEYFWNQLIRKIVMGRLRVFHFASLVWSLPYLHFRPAWRKTHKAGTSDIFPRRKMKLYFPIIFARFSSAFSSLYSKKIASISVLYIITSSSADLESSMFSRSHYSPGPVGRKSWHASASSAVAVSYDPDTSLSPGHSGPACLRACCWALRFSHAEQSWAGPW